MCITESWYCKNMQELSEFVKKYPVRSFDKDQVLLTAGENTEHILVISSGFAKVSATDRAGNEQMLWLAGRLDIIPSEQLLKKKAELAFSYTALSSLVAYEVKKADFIEFASATPKLMLEIARGMSGHYDDLLYRLSAITQASAREKLIHTLYNIAERFSANDEVNFVDIGLNITHQDFAGLIHASRETASIELKKLKDEKVIYYDRNSFVVYVDKLRAILE